MTWFGGWKQRAVVTFGVLLVAYAVLAIRFHTGHPQVKRNFSREYNARIASVPEAQRGLKDLKAALEVMEPAPGPLSKRWPEYEPDDAHWPEFVEYVKSMSGAIPAIRAAAAKPSFGLELSDAIDPTWNVGRENRAKAQAQAATENPFMLNVTLPHLGALRSCSRLLRADARIAAEVANGERAAADLGAMVGLASLAREHALLINDLVSNALLSAACHEVGRVTWAYPQLMNDAQLGELAARLTAFAGGGRIAARFDAETAFVEDFLQRTYTDDGNGDGRLCMDGMRRMARLASPDEPGWDSYVFGPIASMNMASRKELSTKWRELLDIAQKDASTPAWKRGEWGFEAAMESIDRNPSDAKKYRILTMFAPAVPKAVMSFEQATFERDVAVLELAVARYRLAHGAYPDTVGAIVPEFAPAVVVDMFDGKPVRYQVRDGRPFMYSVGCDMVDDGGVPTQGNPDNALAWRPPSRRKACAKGDLVLWPWAVPAKKVDPEP